MAYITLKPQFSLKFGHDIGKRSLIPDIGFRTVSENNGYKEMQLISFIPKGIDGFAPGRPDSLVAHCEKSYEKHYEC